MTTTSLDLDALVDDLRAGEARWAATTLDERAAILVDLSATTHAHAAEWVDVACRIKGVDPTSPHAGEEWLSGPYALLGGIEALLASVRALAAGRSPVDGFDISPAPGGRVAVRVLPHTPYDRLLLNGFSVTVWSMPGVTAEQMRADSGLAERDPERTNGVGVVLGAGNVFSIAPLDALHELFAQNRTVLLKLNPLTDPLKPVLEKVFTRLIGLGLVRIVAGDAAVGAAAVNHPGTGHVHITGSLRSHDAIVFGNDEQARERCARGEVVLAKPITSELGGVSPTIVVPGRWSKRDLAYQAEHLVTQKLHNNGYNCVAVQVVVLSSDWPQRADFLEQLRTAYERAGARPAYYPGSAERLAAAASHHDGARRFGPDGSRVLLEDVPAGADVFTEEYFGPVLAITWLPGEGREFLDAAVAFANERLAGTLGANLVVDRRTTAALGSSLDEAVAALRYGTIAINAWTALGYLTARAPWGAFPGNTPADAQSGVGVVHNGLLLEHTERTIVRGPFRPFPRSVATGQLTLMPRPPWFVTNRTSATTARRLVDFAFRPRWRHLPGILISALRG